MRPDSLVRLQSLTKPVTAAVTMMLVEEGSLELTQPVREWLPSFADLRLWPTGEHPTVELTVAHLLTHTGGLGLGTGLGDFEQLCAAAGLLTPQFGPRYPLADCVDRIARLPIAFEPGTRWHYSLSYEVLARLVELVSGTPLGQAFRERVFEPLGMGDTGFYVPPEKVLRLGPQYWPSDHHGAASSTIRVPAPAPVPTRSRPAVADWCRPSATTCGSRGLLAAGGTLDGVTLLSPESVRAMSSNQLPEAEPTIRWDDEADPTLGYGYGLGVGLSSPRRIGWFGASGCQVWIYPDRDLVIVAASQSTFDLRATDAYIDALQALD